MGRMRTEPAIFGDAPELWLASDHLLRADVFRLRTDVELHPAAELDEAVWLTDAEARALGDRLAPLARELLAFAAVPPA